MSIAAAASLLVRRACASGGSKVVTPTARCISYWKAPANKSFFHGLPPTDVMLSRSIHVTKPLKVHPALLLLLKPLGRISALLVGKRVRIWYKNLPDSEKKKLKNKIKKNRHLFLLGGAGLTGLATFLYVTHLEDCPITNRRKFVALTQSQIKKISTMEFEKLLEHYQDWLVPSKHSAYATVARVSNRILKANRDLEQIYGKDWTITVVDDPTKNAFVLPGGNIFIFTGMLEMCENDDQLGIIISHEISHCILGHIAEKLSYGNLVTLVVLIPLALLWALLPNDGIALVADWFFQCVVDVFVNLPFSRNMETEADEVGLLLASKACFDVREAVNFWGNMAKVEASEGDSPPEFISTHPSHETRQLHLKLLLPAALEKRLECGCAKLGQHKKSRTMAVTEILNSQYAKTLRVT